MKPSDRRRTHFFTRGLRAYDPREFQGGGLFGEKIQTNEDFGRGAATSRNFDQDAGRYAPIG